MGYFLSGKSMHCRLTLLKSQWKTPAERLTQPSKIINIRALKNALTVSFKVCSAPFVAT